MQSNIYTGLDQTYLREVAKARPRYISSRILRGAEKLESETDIAHFVKTAQEALDAKSR